MCAGNKLRRKSCLDAPRCRIIPRRKSSTLHQLFPPKSSQVQTLSLNNLPSITIDEEWIGDTKDENNDLMVHLPPVKCEDNRGGDVQSRRPRKSLSNDLSQFSVIRNEGRLMLSRFKPILSPSFLGLGGESVSPLLCNCCLSEYNPLNPYPCFSH